MAAFVVKQIEEVKHDDDDFVKEFTHDRTGITITFRSFENTLFQKAHMRIIGREHLDLQELKALPKNEHFFDGIESDAGSSSGELMIDAIGRYLIADWNVNDEKHEKLPISGASFKLLMANIPQRQQTSFLQWCLDRAGDVAIMKAEALEDIKKKPSNVTSGKKTTKP